MMTQLEKNQLGDVIEMLNHQNGLAIDAFKAIKEEFDKQQKEIGLLKKRVETLEKWTGQKV